MQESVDDDDLDDTYLVHTRNFILDEVEADIVYLQNKTIGKNHIQWDPNSRYKAWYKAYDKVIIGDTITPKTNLGPFIIEKTGEVNAYACNGVVMKPGFHTQQGSKYHAFVHCDGCSRPREQGMKTNNGGSNESNADEKLALHVVPNKSEDDIHQKTVLKVYPNPSDNGFTIEFPEMNGFYIITNTNGKRLKESKVLSKTIFIELPKGIYFVKWKSTNGVQTKKIIAL
ncbi:T9SS type A sorting domain-containing protein [Brumimicrobium oceani]|nr:T9SS type A sorting domain-containing protein [Brumimicrobium oceani]